MADISVERKGRSPLAWILGLLLLAALAFLVWTYVRDDDDAPAPAPAANAADSPAAAAP